MAGSTAVANNGGPTALPPVMQAAAEARATGAKTRTSRTSIPTQSGKWILGKTIGAGSMGKVKLARKEDSTEQVGLYFLYQNSSHSPLCYKDDCRPLLFPANSISSYFVGRLQDHSARFNRGWSSKSGRQGEGRPVKGNTHSPRSCHSHTPTASAYLRSPRCSSNKLPLVYALRIC